VSEIPTAARQAVRERQDRQCARCGAAYSEIHHRLRRREGGHRLSILVGLCSTCHRWAHANYPEAQAAGYRISVHETDPAAVPIRTFMGWMLFDDEGGCDFTAAPQEVSVT
jgi:hypothetical protein